MKYPYSQIFVVSTVLSAFALPVSAQFVINDSGYFDNQGSNLVVFDDVYAEGHQGGITLVQQSQRVAASGDVRLEVSQGQWQGLPKLIKKEIDKEKNEIRVELFYPDSTKHQTGFNPMLYADFQFGYTLRVKGEEDHLLLTVELDRPVPEWLAGKAGFNLELQPSTLLGKPWIMDEKSGLFPHQAMAPTQQQESNTMHLGDYYRSNGYNQPAKLEYLLSEPGVFNPYSADAICSAPLATGRTFVLNPQNKQGKVLIESLMGDLKLYDGRINHNNGWFVLRSEFAAGAQGVVAQWKIQPQVAPEWRYKPVVQTSQLGYHPDQDKMAVIERDQRTRDAEPASLYRINAKGEELVMQKEPMEWGNFQRYNYLQFDFSDIREEGLYQIRYGESESVPFRIASDVWERGLWQTEIEYFLPIQMCHMRVSEKYRLWHDFCHDDDALMAPVDFNHIDGYTQGPSTLTQYKSGEHIEGLNLGGWHDAGDWDLRVESQSIQAYLLALQVENLGAYWDETSIDQATRLVEIHQPDGKNDFLQQIEHGALTLVAGWKQLGRLYRGIICPTVRQYVFLGDAGGHTDQKQGTADDRWVFTEENPQRELQTAAYLAAIARVLRNYNDSLADDCLSIAQQLFEDTPMPTDQRMARWMQSAQLHAAVELFLSTGDQQYRKFILDRQRYILDNMQQTAWFVARFVQKADDKKFAQLFVKALPELRQRYEQYLAQTPYGVPHDHGNRGSGSWEPQHEGFTYSMLHDAYPDLFPIDYVSHCVQFFLGMHPGSNRASFIAGVGAETVKAIYGGNRADWSYIPGAVTPGTNLIRPDLPELLRFPFIWQQGEFCIDGHNTWFYYMALQLANHYRK